MKTNRHKTSKVSIDIYDMDGEHCETLDGPMDGYDLKAQMIDILKNDGIPIVRCHGKHEAADPKPAPKPNPEFSQPMTLQIQFKDVKFMAVGKFEDVMDAQTEFLKAIIKAE